MTQAQAIDQAGHEQVYALVVSQSELIQKYADSILRELIQLENIVHVQSDQQAMEHIEKNQRQHCSFVFYEQEKPGSLQDEFILELRKHRMTTSTPLVILSQQQPEDYDAEQANALLINYLQRPFSPAALISLLFKLFEEKDRRFAKRVDTHGLPCIVDMGYYTTQPYAAKMINLSISGCLLYTRHQADDCGGVGDIGNIRFNTDQGDAIEITGSIVRCEQEDWNKIAFQFQDWREQDRQKVAKYIASLSNSE